jgi:hypothetical protein
MKSRRFAEDRGGDHHAGQLDGLLLPPLACLPKRMVASLLRLTDFDRAERAGLASSKSD